LSIAPAPFLTQLRVLTGRALRRTIRNPAATLPNGFIAAFLLFVYNGLLGSSEPVQALTGGNYVNFVLPVAVLSSSLSAANAGLSLVDDVEAGYFDRQLAMPLSRLAIIAAPMLIGALQAAVQGAIVVVLGLLLGADPETGALGLLVVVGFAFLWGLGYGGFSVAVALRTKNAEAAFAASFLLFPIIFLGPTFLPEDQLQGWIRALAQVNPAAYVLEGMRAPLIDGWQVDPLWQGLLWGSLFAALTIGIAALVARRAVTAH
jgi:ABC-2 type transport system permease protein